MNSIGDAARTYVKRHRKELCEQYCNKNVYRASSKPLTIFMAGSPGAGKTEASKVFISILERKYNEEKIVRIDADEIRASLPNYVGKNANEFQSAANLGVEKLFDYVLENQQHCIVDGTLSSYQVAEKNIKRAVHHNRSVGILYIYLDPLIAWELTKKRACLDGRYIPKDVFISDFFAARENVDKLKEQFRDELTIYYFEKKDLESNAKVYYNVDTLDRSLSRKYTIGLLTKKLK